MTTNERKISGQSPFPQDPADCLQMARNIFNKARKVSVYRLMTGKRCVGILVASSYYCAHYIKTKRTTCRFQMAHRYPLADQRVMFDENADKLRWFMLPSEAQDLLLGNSQKVKTVVPFSPGEYNGTRNNSISEESVTDASPTIIMAPPPSLPVTRAGGVGSGTTTIGVSYFAPSYSTFDQAGSMYTRHNSLTSFETSSLKRSSR